jgi:hypothetical protein
MVARFPELTSAVGQLVARAVYPQLLKYPLRSGIFVPCQGPRWPAG